MTPGHKGDVVAAALFNRRYDKLTDPQRSRVHGFITDYTAAPKLPPLEEAPQEAPGGPGAAGFEGHAPTVKIGPAK